MFLIISSYIYILIKDLLTTLITSVFKDFTPHARHTNKNTSATYSRSAAHSKRYEKMSNVMRPALDTYLNKSWPAMADKPC